MKISIVYFTAFVFSACNNNEPATTAENKDSLTVDKKLSNTDYLSEKIVTQIIL